MAEDEEIEVHMNQQHMKSDLGLVHMKMNEIANVLKDFKASRDPNMSRKDYIGELKQCIRAYYEYNSELTTYLVDFFSPNELLEYLEANE
jgi:ribosomal RNA methyltransferase Nop2